MGFGKFLKKVGRQFGDVFESVGENIVPLVTGDVTTLAKNALGKVTGTGAAPTMAPQVVYQQLPPAPAPRKRRRKVSGELEPKMDLVPGLSKNALLIGGATAAGVAILFAARGK